VRKAECQGQYRLLGRSIGNMKIHKGIGVRGLTKRQSNETDIQSSQSANLRSRAKIFGSTLVYYGLYSQKASISSLIFSWFLSLLSNATFSPALKKMMLRCGATNSLHQAGHDRMYQKAKASHTKQILSKRRYAPSPLSFLCSEICSYSVS
jgi:hypothetical protein